MIDAQKLERIKVRCGFSDGLCISSNGRSGRMGFWWKGINMTVKSYSNHHFDAEVMDHNEDVAWKVGGVYGWPERENKHLTWELMEIYGVSVLFLLFYLVTLMKFWGHRRKRGEQPGEKGKWMLLGRL